MSIPAQIKYIVLTVLFCLSTFNIFKTTLNIFQSSKRLESLHGEVDSLEQKRDTLIAETEYKKTTDYIEEKARNELNFIKPGESVFVMPKKVLGIQDERGDFVGPTTQDKVMQVNNKVMTQNNAKMWLELFF